MKRASKPLSKLIPAFLICVGFLSVGCSGPDAVDAVPRTSSNQPVFDSSKPIAEAERPNDFDFSFVHEDHLACISVNVQKVIGNADLADVPWSLVEKQLASIIGPSNAILENIDRLWILVDRSAASIEAMTENKSPVVFVVDFAKIGNVEELTAFNNEENTDQANRTAVTKIGANRIVIGDPAITGKIGKSTGRSSLVRQLEQLELNADVDGLVDIKPIRNQFQEVFDSIALFGGEAFATYARLPDALQRVEVSLSLSSEEMLRAVAHIDDDELIKELVNVASEGGQSGSPLTGGMPFGLSQLTGGRSGSADRTPSMMIEPTSTKLFVEIGNEISEEDLFSITGNDKKLTLTLGRPAQIKKLIAALLYDGKRQFDLAERQQNLNKIAVAMEDYLEKYECFPPSGVVAEGGDDGLPAQFNWRVGLLPFLDQQELYDSFDFSKPWDNAENLEAAKGIPSVFAETNLDVNGAESKEVSTLSKFHVVGGSLGLYLNDRTPKLSDITDKRIWTAVVVESAPTAAVEWTKPGSLVVGSTDLSKLGTNDENGVLFISAAFKVRVITKDQDKVNGVVTPNGDETLKSTDFLPLAF